MPITFPLSPLTIVVEIALGVDPSSDPAGWSWTNITSFVRYAPGISITKGRRDESSRVDSQTARLTLDNRDGRFCRRNPMSPYFGSLSKNTPIRIGVNPGTGVVYRFHGYVTEWPTRWSKDGRDSTVPITCAGILRRLTRQRKLATALARAMAGISAGDFVPIAYWPMEDGADATQFASALSGSPVAAVSGDVGPAAYSGFVGSLPLPVLRNGSVLCDLPAYADTGHWQIQFTLMIPSSGFSNNATLAIVDMVSGHATAQIFLTYIQATGALRLSANNAAGTTLDQADTIASTWQRDTPYLCAITDFVSAGSHVVALSIYQTNGSGLVQLNVFPDGVGAGTAGMPRRFTAYATSVSSGWSLGHVAPYTADIISTPNIGPNAQAAGGYVGETATDRMTRLCREEGVSFTTSATTSAAMGPQATGTLLDLLRDCETADGGVLYEDQFGLGYLAASQRYNLATTLALDFNAGDIAEPPEPADDDQRTVNRYIASRTSGSSATFADSASIADDGLYESGGTFNVQADTQLLDIASWRVHLGTVDEDRWPAIPIRLARTPARITAWTAMTIGGRMTVANPPDQTTPDTIDTIVEGWTETITPHMWEAVLNTSPASPFRIGVVTTAARIDTTTSTLAAACTTTATSLSVATTGSLWTTTATFPADFPFDIDIEGERITVTAITGTSSPQTFTVTRSVNGIVKAHDPGDKVSLFAPYYVGL